MELVTSLRVALVTRNGSTVASVPATSARAPGASEQQDKRQKEHEGEHQHSKHVQVGEHERLLLHLAIHHPQCERLGRGRVEAGHGENAVRRFGEAVLHDRAEA